MKLIKANWQDCLPRANAAFFTGNSYVKNDGALVMGRGIALAIAQRFPEAPYTFGMAILSVTDIFVNTDLYGIIEPIELEPKTTPIGIFQVKYHWKDDADLSLIQYSVYRMNHYLKDKPDSFRVLLNYPGIGNGRLAMEQVRPYIEKLDDRVIVVYR